MKTWAASTFNQIAAVLATDPSLTWDRIQTLVAHPSPDMAARGHMLALAWTYTHGRPAELPAIIEQAGARFPVLPPALFTLLLAARHLAGQADRIPADFLDYGCAAIDAGNAELGIEAIGTAFIEDADSALTLICRPDQLQRGTVRYESAALAHNPGLTRIRHPAGGPIHIGMLVSNLVDDVVAYSRRVLDFARHLDPARFRLHVYSTENLCLRTHQLPARCMANPSPEWAPKTLAFLAAAGVPVHLAPRDVPYLTAARTVATQIAADGIDVLILQSGPTMPIDWLACRWAPVPVKLQIHIGAPAYQRGISATLFDNAVNLERERATWPGYAGELLLVRQGTDLDAIDAQLPPDRASLGLPPDAVLIGVLSNHLDKRLSPAYLEVITSVLASEPATRFIPIGGRSLPPHVAHHFQAAGLSGRVLHIPVQREVGRALKLLDIYANEFPVGGSQSVVEAMACSLPVAAMRHGAAHVECAGADIVGPPFALEHNDPAAYLDLILSWVRNPGARRAAGATLRHRAETTFSIRDYVRQIAALGSDRLVARE